jgi:hypothetical protein
MYKFTSTLIVASSQLLFALVGSGCATPAAADDDASSIANIEQSPSSAGGSETNLTFEMKVDMAPIVKERSFSIPEWNQVSLNYKGYDVLFSSGHPSCIVRSDVNTVEAFGRLTAGLKFAVGPLKVTESIIRKDEHPANPPLPDYIDVSADLVRAGEATNFRLRCSLRTWRTNAQQQIESVADPFKPSDARELLLRHFSVTARERELLGRATLYETKKTK